MSGKLIPEIKLSGLFHPYYKTNTSKKYEIFHNPINNNTIFFYPHDDCTTESIINSTLTYRYKYLIEALNANTNVLVYWSQVEGTMAYYTIFHDAPLTPRQMKSYQAVSHEMSQLVHRNLAIGALYGEVIGGIQKQIDFGADVAKAQAKRLKEMRRDHYGGDWKS